MIEPAATAPYTMFQKHNIVIRIVLRMLYTIILIHKVRPCYTLYILYSYATAIHFYIIIRIIHVLRSVVNKY